MIKLGGLLLVIAVIFWLWCLFDALTSDARQVRLLPKLVWVVLIVLFVPVLGPAAWMLLGRPRGGVRPALPGGGSFGPFGSSGGNGGPGNIGGSGRPGRPGWPGRPGGSGSGSGSGSTGSIRPVGPDDDPDFLRGI
ncbi:hypothetical protein BH10ACT8_BH10ACT8_10000 [soil metagenome]